MSDFTQLAVVGVLATAMAPVVREVLQFVKGLVDKDNHFSSQVWVLAALAVGVGAAFFLQPDVSKVPLNEPKQVVWIVLGLYTGALASGYHAVVKKVETKARLNAKKLVD